MNGSDFKNCKSGSTYKMASAVWTKVHKANVEILFHWLILPEITPGYARTPNNLQSTTFGDCRGQTFSELEVLPTLDALHALKVSTQITYT